MTVPWRRASGATTVIMTSVAMMATQMPCPQHRSWATVVVRTTVAADGKTREKTFIDRRTFTMWLATIDTGRLDLSLVGPVVVW